MCRVLAVDDQPANRVPLVRLFQFAGIAAESVGSGLEALAFLAQQQPDVVLLDVMMPDMDGFQVLQAIRADRRHDAVAVLMYSAVADAPTQNRALALGAQGYILKGTSFATLRAEVERHFVDPDPAPGRTDAHTPPGPPPVPYRPPVA